MSKVSISDLRSTVDDKTLSMVKQSLRLEFDDDDTLIKSIIKASRADIMGQVGTEIDDFYDDNEVFNIAAIMLAGHLYTNQQATSTKETYEVDKGLAYLINSMKDDYRLQIANKRKEEADSEEP